MKVKGLIWLGTRTDRFEEMARLYEEVMGLETVSKDESFAEYRLPGGESVELFGPSETDHQHFTTGPVVGFEVDDVPAARAEMEAKGITFIGPIGGSADGYGWSHFWAPDGNIYEIAGFRPQ